MDKSSWVLAQKFPGSLRQQALDNDVRRTTLQYRANGRQSRKDKDDGQLYLYPWEEKALARFLAQQDAIGRSVRVGYIRSIAYGIACQRESGNRPSKPPYKGWPQAFYKRHPDLTASKQQALDWRRFDIHDKVVHWFDVIGPLLQRPDIRPWNVWNYDETGTLLSMPNSVKVVVSKKNKRGRRGARIKRTNITAIECVSADGRHLNPMIIWPASTHRANWTTHDTPGWYYALSDKGYTDSYISLQWLKNIFDPETKELANGEPRVLIGDGFGTHETLEILQYCFDNNIILCRIPSHTSHKLQPCDVSVFSSLKTAYREQVERLERGCVGTIGKEHFTYLYSPARTKAFTPRNIRAGWSKAGLYPFNPNKVLSEVPKPLRELTAPELDVTEVGSYPHDEVPHTPATPVSAEAFNVLSNAIKQLPDNDANRQRKENLQQKLIDGAQRCVAERAILQGQNDFLAQINNEGKKRRSTKSNIVGRAKVMLWEDIAAATTEAAAKEKAKEDKKVEKERKKAETEARKAEQEAKKAEKEAKKANGKSTRERKRKACLAQDASEPSAKSPRMSEMLDTVVLQTDWLGEEQRIAPVARMI